MDNKLKVKVFRVIEVTSDGNGGYVGKPVATIQAIRQARAEARKLLAASKFEKAYLVREEVVEVAVPA